MTMAAKNKTVWKKNPGVIERIIDGEAILLDLKSGVYYSLNGPGAAIWRAIEKPLSVDGIVDAILDEFSGSRTSIEKKVSALMVELSKQKLALKEAARG